MTTNYNADWADGGYHEVKALIICHHHLYPSISIYLYHLYHHHLYPLSLYHEVKTLLHSLPSSSFSIILILSSLSFLSSSSSSSPSLSSSPSSSSGERKTPGRQHDRDGERNLPCSRNYVPGLNIYVHRSWSFIRLLPVFFAIMSVQMLLGISIVHLYHRHQTE